MGEWMYLCCVYVFMYVCMYVCMYIRMYVCIKALSPLYCGGMHGRMYVCMFQERRDSITMLQGMRLCMHVYDMCVRMTCAMHVCKYECVHVSTYVRMKQLHFQNMLAHTHTCMYACMYGQMP